MTVEQRQPLLDIRHEHPQASAPLILRALVAQGVLEANALSAATLARLYADHGKSRARRKYSPPPRSGAAALVGRTTRSAVGTPMSATARSAREPARR